MTSSRPDADPAPRPASRLPVQLAVLIAAAVVVLDQATKELAETRLDPGEYAPLFGDAVGWQLVYNPGAAFGIPAPTWLFLIVTVLVAVIVARALPQTTSLLQASAYGLLLAGALGNAIDRLVRPNMVGETSGFFQGDVVDFVAWGTFPRFNVADSAITVGFVLLTAALWREERVARAELEAAASDEASVDRPGPP
ncbi:signal peptidase II [Egicoccus sp. AB-alg6-2]|uniref:signal peptidase II n=1 Tax=Egicoccus sp. AB-alg6-2 TaxID=3242692 RepID=UPI00359CEB91